MRTEKPRRSRDPMGPDGKDTHVWMQETPEENLQAFRMVSRQRKKRSYSADHYKNNPLYQLSKDDHRYHRIGEIASKGFNRTPEEKAEMLSHVREHFKANLPDHPGTLGESELSDFQSYHGYGWHDQPNAAVCSDVEQNERKHGITLVGKVDWEQFTNLTGCPDPVEWRRRMLGMHPLIDPQSPMVLSYRENWDRSASKITDNDRRYLDFHQQISESDKSTKSLYDLVHRFRSTVGVQYDREGEARDLASRYLGDLHDYILGQATPQDLKKVWHRAVEDYIDEAHTSTSPFVAFTPRPDSGIKDLGDLADFLHDAIEFKTDPKKHGIDPRHHLMVGDIVAASAHPEQPLGQVIFHGDEGQRYVAGLSMLKSSMLLQWAERQGHTLESLQEARKTDMDLDRRYRLMSSTANSLSDRIMDNLKDHMRGLEFSKINHPDNQEAVQQLLDYTDAEKLWGLRSQDTPPTFLGRTLTTSIDLRTKTPGMPPVLGNMNRTLTEQASGHKFASNDMLVIERHVQGLGLAESMYQSQEEAHKLAGVSEVKVHANISIGGYAWAKQGFDFDDLYTPRSMLAKAKEKVFDAYPNDIIRMPDHPDHQSFLEDMHPITELENRLERTHSWDIATLSAKGDPIGKEVMLGSNWYGTKELSDSWKGNIPVNISRAKLFGIDIKEGE